MNVSKIVQKYGRNPFDIAKANKIIIVGEPLGNIYGYYSKAFDRKIIHINEKLPEYFWRYVVAHCLYSPFNNPEEMLFLKEKTGWHFTETEKAANKFAVELMFPEEELKKYDNIEDFFAGYDMSKSDIDDLFARFERILNSSERSNFNEYGDYASCSRTKRFFYILNDVRNQK